MNHLNEEEGTYHTRTALAALRHRCDTAATPPRHDGALASLYRFPVDDARHHAVIFPMTWRRNPANSR
jgi:hypothetical protein